MKGTIYGPLGQKILMTYEVNTHTGEAKVISAEYIKPKEKEMDFKPVFAHRFTNVDVNKCMYEANLILDAYFHANIDNNRVIETAQRRRKSAESDGDLRDLLIWTLVEYQAFEAQIKREDPGTVQNEVRNGGF